MKSLPAPVASFVRASLLASWCVFVSGEVTWAQSPGGVEDPTVFMLDRHELNVLADYIKKYDAEAERQGSNRPRSACPILASSSDLRARVLDSTTTALLVEAGVRKEGVAPRVAVWFRTKGALRALRLGIGTDDTAFIVFVLVDARVQVSLLSSARVALQQAQRAESAGERSTALAAAEAQTAQLIDSETDAGLREFYAAVLGSSATPILAHLPGDSRLAAFVSKRALTFRDAVVRADALNLDVFPDVRWSPAIEKALIQGGVTRETASVDPDRVVRSASDDLRAVLVPLQDPKGLRVLVIEERGCGVATLGR